MDKQELQSTKKGNLLIGLAAILAVIIIVVIIGLLTIRPEQAKIIGTAEATEYRISSKVPGRIDHFAFEEGDQVRKGDTLVFIDSPEVMAKLAQAQAARAGAQAQSKKALKGARSEQIQGAYELWQKALVGVDIAKKSYDRVQHLYEKEVISAQKRDEAEAQYKAAQATAAAAKSQYDMAVNGAQQEDKEAAQSLVDRADGAVSEVESYLNEIRLTSPIDGEVSDRFPKQGELVGQGAPIMNIVDLNDAWFTFNVRENQLSGITTGTEFSVRIPALDNQVYKLRVTHIKVMAGYATWRATKMNGDYDVKTFDVKARPIEQIPNLRPGMTAIIVE
ncbi:MAG: efflux RND transporter periplasmic adaptor subunit [Paludibacteraceae bacterium]|nr:efflux RND transporter periplasmic adaptor subunit [Paludibacteraceae bacterium]